MGNPGDSDEAIYETPMVLVFGGDPVNLRFISRLLSLEGYAVRHTSSTDTAVGIVRKESPDIAVVDLSWSDRIGLDQVAELKNEKDFREAPLILLGEQDDENWIASAYLAGATDYIRKPYGKRELLIRIDNQLYLKQRRDLLKEKLVIKDKMFSIIGHDLKNPIYRIQQILGEIRDENITEGERNTLYTMIDNATVRASTILNDLLEWARVVYGDRVLVDDTFRASDEIGRIVAEFDSALLRKEIKLEMEIDKGLLLNMDKNCFSMILRNLLENAVKFSRRGGLVKLKLQTGKSCCDDVEMLVIDEGPGIDPARLKELFREDKIQSYPGTENERGSGMGLLLVREFLNRYRGKIDIVSNPGKGTIVSVTIPGFHESSSMRVV
jgi:signal transduction histidine kinase